MQQAEEVVSNAAERTSVLLESKKRKQVEKDAIQLQNRLLQLERQAQKADKRISLTKKRAEDILSQRERNEQRERERKQILAELQLEVQQHRRDMERCVCCAVSSCLQHGPRVSNEFKDLQSCALVQQGTLTLFSFLLPWTLENRARAATVRLPVHMNDHSSRLGGDCSSLDLLTTTSQPRVRL
jgi:hypothetical protein